MAKREAKTPESKPDILTVSGRRFGGLHALSGLSPRLTDPLLRKRGFVEARVVRDWPSIIGEIYAKSCQPTALKFQKGRRDGGVLELRVISGLALEIQHRLPLLIERINMHFGWAAVERVKIRQGALPPRRPPSRKHLRPLSLAEREEIAARVTPVADDGLRDSLRLLGEAIRASRPADRS
ncbi:MAG: DciA family protein [Alphaproteobacteria bacterium]|nr:DciA family protein [Alphaproteobacteria bacterium]